MRENVQAVRDAVVRCQQERRIAKPTYICWVAGSEGAENQAFYKRQVFQSMNGLSELRAPQQR